MKSKAFKNASLSKSKDLYGLYPDLMSVFNNEDTQEYKTIFISAFEFWPSSEQFSRLVAYPDNFYKNHESFNYSLLETFNCFTVRFKGLSKNKIIFKEILQSNMAKKFLSPSAYNISSNSYFNILLPECEAVYLENSDFTNVLYYKNEKKIIELIKLCKTFGLFVLK